MSRLGLAFTVVVVGIDVLLGSHVDLIGLLVLGPACAAISLRPRSTLAVSVWAVALAIALGVPDGIWATYEHITFVGVVAFVGVANTSVVAILSLRAAKDLRETVP